MAVFKNTTNHPVKIIVNGNRKTIKPGTIIHGPDSLETIPGLTLINKTLKTVIPNKNDPISHAKKIPDKITNSQKISKFDEKGSTSLTDKINKEIKHLETYKNYGDLPSVTIAILTKESYKLIKDCCESIFKHVKYPKVSILIIDTGTKNETVFKYYKSVKAKCKERNYGYKLIQVGNYHFGKNYNEAIFNHVSTDYVLIQNNDTKAINDYITKMMQLISINKIGSVGCRMFYPDKKIQHDGQGIYDRFGRLISPGHVNFKLKKEQLHGSQNRPTLVDGNTGAGVLVKTNDFKTVGGFDEKYKDIFQDVDLMVKINNLIGKFNYCHRNAEIIHLDNASRFQKGLDINRVHQMYEDTAYFKNKISKYRWNKIPPEECDISIITLVHDMKEYKNLTDSLKNQKGKHKIEIIAIPNFYNQFESIPLALNNALDVCNGKNVIFIHQDVIVPKDWLNKIRKHIQQLDAERINWGVLGPAGITIDSKPYYYLSDSSLKKMHKQDKPRNEVFCLDEMCLIINKRNGLRFTDSKLNGFHFYGGDICVTAQTRGLKNFAIDVYCFHNSYDGRKNLMTEDSYKKFVDQAKKFHIMLREKGIKKWRTTTAMGLNNKIIFYLSPPDYTGSGYYVVEC